MRYARRVCRKDVERILKRLPGVLDGSRCRQTAVCGSLSPMLGFDEVVDRRHTSESRSNNRIKDETKLDVVASLITLPCKCSSSQAVCEPVDEVV
jgi:hypothetical protein